MAGRIASSLIQTYPCFQVSLKAPDEPLQAVWWKRIQGDFIVVPVYRTEDTICGAGVFMFIAHVLLPLPRCPRPGSPRLRCLNRMWLDNMLIWHYQNE